MFAKLLRKKKDTLEAGVIPGTRSVNNVPLFIGGGLLLIFGVVIAYVMTQRANQGQQNGENAKPQGTTATRFAAEFSDQWGQGGMIPADTIPAKPESAPSLSVPQTPTEPANPKDTTPLDLPPLDTTLRPSHGPEAMAVHNTRLQAFQAGLVAKTGVQTAELRSRPGQRPGVQDATRYQVEGNNDATAAYKTRLAQLRGEATNTGQSVSSPLTGGKDARSNEISQFNRGNRWTLGQEVEAPLSPYTLRAGFVIPAIMLSGINSNLPGQVMGQVSQNVYDTPTGKHLLIPQGTRLIGTYNSDVGYGQERVLMAWQRLVFPDGKALDIETMPGADSAGMAGFTDQINNHYFRTFSSAFLLSGVIAAVSLSQPQDSNTNNANGQRSSDALSEALGQTLGTTMAEMIRKNLNIAPTLEIRPGYRFNVMVTKDMQFKGPYVGFDY